MDNKVVKIILAILLPPAAAYLQVGLTTHFWINLALTLLGGIPGTFHHLYFSGTPVSITAIGATFSALEVVPLVLIGKEALDTLRVQRRAAWMERYRWPLRFFLGVTFWNLVGAGLFGFLINPISCYYCFSRSGELQCVVAEVIIRMDVVALREIR